MTKKRERLDTILEAGKIFDGKGGKAFVGDIGIAGERIRAIGDLTGAPAERRIPLEGLAVCPGFVDVHTHVDLVAARGDAARVLEPLVRQGITTVVGGNCGASVAPAGDNVEDLLMMLLGLNQGDPDDDPARFPTMASFFEALEARGLPLNLGVLAPHNLFRMRALGMHNGRMTREGLSGMKRDLAECLEAGCLGLSLGLQYFPGMAAEWDELFELATLVGKAEGVVTAHLRSYCSDTLDRAADEILSLARACGVQVQLSHMFWVPSFGQPINRGLKTALRALSRIHEVRPFTLPLPSPIAALYEKIAAMNRRGLVAGVDAMPTSASFTFLAAFLPPWALTGSLDAIVARLRDSATRRLMRRDMEQGRPTWPHRDADSWSLNIVSLFGWDSIRIMSVASERNRSAEGKTLSELGRARGAHPMDVLCELLIEERGSVLAFISPTYPGDPLVEMFNRALLLDPHVSIVTDTLLSGFGVPSHLFYDCFPRFLGSYARERKWLSLEEAIRKCTSLPASQLKLRDRGVLKEGSFADLVVFDPATIGSRSTPRNPKRHPQGIRAVYLNGKPILDDAGYHPELRPGHLLRRG